MDKSFPFLKQNDVGSDDELDIQCRHCRDSSYTKKTGSCILLCLCTLDITDGQSLRNAPVSLLSSHVSSLRKKQIPLCLA